jgi:NAD(P)-dependent dehydrogenase (short-subunit alcohol dehydrogenase family)
MTKIMVLGAGLGLGLAIASALASRGYAVEIADYPRAGIAPAMDDPFTGGRRSKGDKKRAASERRSRGGY